MDGLEGARHTVFPLWPLPVNSPQVHKNCSDVPMSRLKGPQGNGAGWTQHLQEDLGPHWKSLRGQWEGTQPPSWPNHPGN